MPDVASSADLVSAVQASGSTAGVAAEPTPPQRKTAAELAPSVSIIITTFNHARFLADAIRSALAQTVRPSEVIVVDDGSTDDPARVVAGLPEVRMIRQPNQGLASARNTGWRAAAGDHVVFLDADDRLLPNALAVNLRQFSQSPDCALVFGGYRWVDVEGRPVGDPEVPPAVGDDAYGMFLAGNCIGMHATVMYRRHVIDEVGSFDERLRACEDYDLYLRVARGHRVASTTECLAEYRRHDSNMSGNLPLMLASALGALRRQRPHIGEDPGRRAAYRRGIKDWKRFYVGQYLRGARARMGSADSRRILARDGFRLLHLAPVTLVRAGLGLCYRRLRKTGVLVRDRLLGRRSGRVRFGDLRRTTPISGDFGYSRGKPVDRHYVEDFLQRHSQDIRGRVLEIGDNAYTVQFGGDRITLSDVLHVSAASPQATFVGDLANGDHLPGDAFDCIILTQTLHLIYDMHRAIATLHRILKPGGVLLLTVPGVSGVDRGEWGGSWYWSFTPAALSRLLEERFPRTGLDVSSYGNVLTASAFLYGLAEHELTPAEFDASDPSYPVIVAARAVKEA